jgi:hypothetical protein
LVHVIILLDVRVLSSILRLYTFLLRSNSVLSVRNTNKVSPPKYEYEI